MDVWLKPARSQKAVKLREDPQEGDWMFLAGGYLVDGPRLIDLQTGEDSAPEPLLSPFTKERGWRLAEQKVE